MNSLTLVANDEHFIVDSYMGVYYLPLVMHQMIRIISTCLN